MMKYVFAGIGSISLLIAVVVGANTLERPKLARVENANDAMIVYKSPTCGCCALWIDHVEDNEFHTEAREVSDLNMIKREKGIAARYQSCHTAVHPSGLVFEGHVPAEAMKRLIENPINESIGLAVPGMPVGSPGMEYENRVDPYEIKLLLKDGSSRTYAYVDRGGIRY
ncbi:MAG: DUF411 domain-containing protein [Planctomycetaceae bacterium]|jgi:hypothetical protein|nr:DUF411 domain-containing protein [Planctomycetaceae bacterium]MDG1232623.1 DUF411 domain-containing protein [Pseudomonadales bacterium]